MKAISLWQPWCFAITHLGKDIENRVWRTHYRGPLLLHAAKRRPTIAECELFLDLAEDILSTKQLFDQLATLPDADTFSRPIDILRSLPRGGIVGRVDVVGCDRNSSSLWAFRDQFHWRVENAVKLPFKPVLGQRGFFQVDMSDCGP